MSEPDLPPFDVEALIALVRGQDASAIAEAYRRTFDNTLGRLVLADFLAECGVGARRGAGVNRDDLFYAAGLHDAGLSLAEKAGFDQASIVALTISDQLKGHQDDQVEPQNYDMATHDDF